jgi:GNAT superfamily N-acetyltransferase
MEWKKRKFVLTDEDGRVDATRTYELLQATYWGVRRPREVVRKMIDNSLCFGLFLASDQIGFGRAVTDYTVFSWIADLVIDGQYRGQGLGTWMMECIVAHPAIRGTQMVLQTRDAHSLYEKYGFLGNPALMSTPVAGL